MASGADRAEGSSPAGRTAVVERVLVDLFVAGATPLDSLQLSRRREVDLDGRRLFVHPAEDICCRSCAGSALVVNVRTRQWHDVLRIVRVQGPHLDREYPRAHALVLEVLAQ